MERVSKLFPGYDCRKECQHEHRGEHGICADVWWYAVTDTTRAVALQVMSADYPASVERAELPRVLQGASGACMTFHVADSESDRECGLVSCGKCRLDYTYLGARDFWKEHHVGEQRDQPESFWLALEARLP